MSEKANEVKTMFGKLKEKLKGALSIFSKKTEEVAVEKVEVEEKKVVSEGKELFKTINEEKKKQKTQKKEKFKEKKREKKTVKEEKLVEEKIKDRIEWLKEEVSVEKTKEAKGILNAEDALNPEEPEKKSFFSKIKEKFQKKEEEITKEEKNKEETNKEEPAKETETTEEKSAEESKGEESKGFFSKIKQAITTKTISGEKFEELFWDLELLLLENNMAVEVIEKIKVDLKQELVDKPLPRDVEGKITETLKQTLQEILSLEGKDLLKEIEMRKKENLEKKEKKPYVIAMFGINGAGKTTSLAKLTSYLLRNKYSVVWAASDTFRAAAIQQLEEHAKKLSVKAIKHDYGADAAAVAFDAVKYAEKNNIEVVLIDTAGRLHSNTNLMAELEKIIRVAKPDLKLFVGESITGNDCIEQAKKFQELVDLDGVILTKADVDEKGGAALSVSYVLKKPILFFGVGQRYEDLEPFDKEKVLERLGL